MSRYSQFGPGGMIFSKKEALKLAMLKLGVTLVLRVGAFLQRQGRTASIPPRPRLPAA